MWLILGMKEKMRKERRIKIEREVEVKRGGDDKKKEYKMGNEIM